MANQNKHYFYDSPIFVKKEQSYINNILKKYKNEPPTEELKKRIWEELQQEKHLGNIRVPFQVKLHKDASGKYPDYIEILLDTKV